MPLKQELSDFLRGECHRRGLSLRGLSINAGLSPATVSNVLTREYQPTLDTLSKLADYLDVRREYLWQLAGLVEDAGCTCGTGTSDTRLESLHARVDKMPGATRKLMADFMGQVLDFLEAGGSGA